MKNISKRLLHEKLKIDKTFLYPVETAVNLVKKTASAKFNESIEAHFFLNIDPKYSDQQLRNTVILPYGTGKLIKIASLVSKEKIMEAKNAGADIYGSDDLLDEITKGNLNFDLLIVTTEMMPKLVKLGRILGPKGLMPSLKAGTVTSDLCKTINEFKKGKLEYRVDKTGIVHISFGKADFSELHLKENLKAFYNSILLNKPIGVKGAYFKTLKICSTMGPSISINCNSF
jgi:large subunit ribosomal protein L1